MSTGPNAPVPQIPGVELLEVIGSGGSGVVYRGRQAAFDRDVAVKVARNVDDADGAPAARWEREVAAVGRLSNHPNIVPVFDAGITDDGSPYLVMPHVPKGSLGDRIRAEGPMDPDEVASVGARLADALATVHAAGVLHRDVKPDNVLWSPHGEPQLTDFGIARLEDLTTTSDVALQATISYAAPEVLAGEPATEASDVYGLGATLYACLTGASPHPSGGENVAALVARVLEEDPPSLAARGIPAGLAAVVERAMARRPQDRHVDARRFRHELERVAGTRVAAAPPPGPDATQRLDTSTLAGTSAVASAEPPPRPRHVVAAPPSRPEPPAPPVEPGEHGDDGGRRSNVVLWGAVAIVLLLAGALVILAGMRGDGDETATTDTTEPAGDTTEPAGDTTTTEAPTSTEPATTTEATTTTTAPTERPSGAAAGDPGETALVYLAALDADELDRAWRMTTPRFQAQQDRGSWEAFWGGHDIDVVGEPRVDRGAGVVVVPLTYDDQREDYRLDVVRQGGGWLIDGPVGS